MLGGVGLLLLSLLVILLGAQLFTNAIEWFGHLLGIAEGAVGSVLAAIGTAMPETMIPLIAILFAGGEHSHDVGIGAIIGAPFLLSTAAFAITGLGVLHFRRSRRTDTTMRVDPAVIRRDLGYFFLIFSLAIFASFVPFEASKYGIAALLLSLYGFYVYRTFSHQGAASTEKLHPLYLRRLIDGVEEPSMTLVASQLFASLALIIAGAQLFVANLEEVSIAAGVPALLLALVIAPLATELPEKFNSIIWVRQGKDTLAMGNISGAMVFQSSVPTSIGVVLTPWELTEAALVSATIAFTSAGLVYLSLWRLSYLSAFVLASCGLFWAGFVGYAVVHVALD
jgi:cation:H+ antiporter